MTPEETLANIMAAADFTRIVLTSSIVAVDGWATVDAPTSVRYAGGGAAVREDLTYKAGPGAAAFDVDSRTLTLEA